MMSRILIAAGVMILGLAWAGPLPRMVPSSLAAHMTLHMTVIGMGVPCLAIGLAMRIRQHVSLPVIAPFIASMTDFVIVWAWHSPALHLASRSDPLVLAVEQSAFAAGALLVWLVAFCGPPLAGALELFFTSMHMVLLGALFALSPGLIYGALCTGGAAGLDPLADQHLGGAIMLGVGGVVYLSGALVLMQRVLRRPGPA